MQQPLLTDGGVTGGGGGGVAQQPPLQQPPQAVTTQQPQQQVQYQYAPANANANAGGVMLTTQQPPQQQMAYQQQMTYQQQPQPQPQVIYQQQPQALQGQGQPQQQQQIIYQPQAQPQQQIIYQPQPQQQPQQQIIYVPQPPQGQQQQQQQPQQQTIIYAPPDYEMPVPSAPTAQQLMPSTMMPTDIITTTGKQNWDTVVEEGFPVPGSGYVHDQDVRPSEGMGCWAGFKASPHLKAWLFTLALLVMLLFQFICVVSLSAFCSCSDGGSVAGCSTSALDCGFPCSFATANVYAWLGTVAVLYLVYCIEFWCASSHKYLKHTNVSDTVNVYVERVQGNAPRIWWRVECYHYETRHKTVSYTDSDGNRKTRTETRREKVVTHRASTNYGYSSWMDTSGAITGLDLYKLTKISYYKTFSFANIATQIDYETRMRFFRMHHDRDVHQSFWFGVEIQEFTSKMLAEVQPGTKPKCLSRGYYLCWSCFGCTTCFRHWFASICGRKQYCFNKQINIFYQQ